MKVKDIMTKNVAYVNPMTNITETAQLMQKHNVGSIPVCDQSGVVGIVTDRDIVLRNVAHGTDPKTMTAKDVMSNDIYTVSPERDADEITDIMSSRQIRRLPVVENNMLIGMVALGDMATSQSFSMEASEALSYISRPSKPEQMP